LLRSSNIIIKKYFFISSFNKEYQTLKKNKSKIKTEKHIRLAKKKYLTKKDIGYHK
jgi:hypothetical protein